MPSFLDYSRVHSQERDFWSQLSRGDFNVNPDFMQTVIENDLFCKMLAKLSRLWAVQYLEEILNEQLEQNFDLEPYTKRNLPCVYILAGFSKGKEISIYQFENRNITNIVKVRFRLHQPVQDKWIQDILYISIDRHGLIDWDLFSCHFENLHMTTSEYKAGAKKDSVVNLTMQINTMNAR